MMTDAPRFTQTRAATAPQYIAPQRADAPPTMPTKRPQRPAAAFTPWQGVTMVATPIKVPRRQKHALRLIIYLLVMGIFIYWTWRDLAMHTSTQYLPATVCTVSVQHECRVQVSGSSVQVYETTRGVIGVATATATP